MSAKQQKTAIVNALEASLNKRKPDALDALYAPTAVYHGSMELKGVRELKNMVSMYLNAFPDLRVTVEDQIAEGDRVVTRVKYTGTHKGELMGIAPTGKKISVRGIAIARFSGDKIVEEWEQADDLGLMQQIGAVPAIGHQPA